jgi:hypothetical protein
MKKYACLNTNNGILLLGVFCVSGIAQAGIMPDEIEFHGFLTQGFFHSSDNNIFGQSDDGISPGLTEIGLNGSYQPLDRLRFTAQGLYRRNGDLDRGSVNLDYGLVDIALLNYESGRVGMRAGRIKTPFGLYNETRDVSFTHPTILLPQGIYFERSRSLLVSSDGGSLYAEQRTLYGDFSVKLNVGIPLGNNREIQSSILGPDAKGEFQSKPAVAAQLNYEINGGKYIFAVSYGSIDLEYQPAAGETLLNGEAYVQSLVFSAQYNGEEFSLTGEFDHRWNNISDFGNSLPDSKSITESWYIQAGYQILPQLQANVRYDVLYNDIDDKNGQRVAAERELPNHIAYANDWMFGLRWDPAASWMLRAEYHRVHGTAWLPLADNPVTSSLIQDWDLYGLQLSFRF